MKDKDLKLEDVKDPLKFEDVKAPHALVTFLNKSYKKRGEENKRPCSS